jgi:hypothetical protein
MPPKRNSLKKKKRRPRIPKAPSIKGDKKIVEEIKESPESSELDIPDDILRLMESVFKKREEYKRKDMRFRCEMCKKPTLLKCSGCYTSYFCCADHQTRYWPSHKEKCLEIRKINRGGKSSYNC